MRNTLLIVDVQNGFTKHKQTKALPQKISELLDRKLFDCVVATRFLNNENSMFEKMFGWTGLKTSEDCHISPQIVDKIDYVFDKHIYNCVSPNFVQKLCQLNDGEYPRKIFIAGVDTDCCVLTIATALFELNIRPVVLTRYCASNGGKTSHIAGIKCMKRLIGDDQLLDKELTTKDDLFI